MNKFAFALIFLAIFCFYRFSFAANSCQVLIHNSQVDAYGAEITVIIGTDRKDSNSKIVAQEIIDQLSQQAGTKINVIDLTELPASLFKSDYLAKKSPQFMKKFVDPIGRSSGLIFIAPEYDGAVPGILSYYMNHMRLPLTKKEVVLIGDSAGKWGARAALDAFKVTLGHRGARLLSDLQINIDGVDQKIQDNKLTDENNKKRISKMAQELLKSLNLDPDSVPAQKTMAQLASALVEKSVDLKLNNGNSVFGKLGGVVLNDNQTLAYVQFAGPTSIRNDGKIIPGQDTDIHDKGYGMPVGKILEFKKEWYLKDNLAETGLIEGKKVKLKYESGVVVNGTIKKLTYDKDGNLLVITFTDVVVKKDKKFLFQKAWGDFDVAVGDFVAQIFPN